MSLKHERLINTLPSPRVETIRKETLLLGVLDLVRERTSTDFLGAQIEMDLALLSSDQDNWPRVSRLLEVIIQSQPENNLAQEW